MDRSLYIAMTGAAQALKAQATNSHNLANVSTTGFKASLDSFKSVPVEGEGHASRVYAVAAHAGNDVSPGPINPTGRELDFAVNGEGWIAVQSVDGNEAYTRAGDLRVSSAGILVTGAGHPVIGNSGPIAIPPAEKLEIGSDGTISIRPLGQTAQSLAVVDRIRLVNPPGSEMRRGGDSLFRHVSNEPQVPDAGVTIQAGALEGSNVSAVESLARMIELSRQFEMQVKVMRAAESNEEKATELMRLG